MPNSQDVDYNAVIADLQRKKLRVITEIDAAIAAIRRVSGLDEANREQAEIELPRGPLLNYHDMSMVDAAKAHLMRRGGGPVTNLELARALQDGGFPHKSKNLANTLNSVLWRRAKTVGDIKKTGRGWELAEK